ncbi:MAG: hypothetical protein ACI8RD_000816 [Bacillariaceae sp.]|jgi:hypothetical protein
MAISYEEALGTLGQMFADPWTRQTLDVVLRHEKGHMENTCELILEHGDKDPQILVDRLKAGGPEPQVAMDEELARQLAAASSSSASNNGSNNRSRGGGGGGGGGGSSQNKGRGTPTTLPDDFLRLPGYRRTSAGGRRSGRTSTNNNNNNNNDGQQPMDDEALARMLQDELFSEELARNPDFAHLAGHGRGGQQQRTNSGRARVSASNARLPSAQGGAPLQNPFEGVNVMQKISSKYKCSLAPPKKRMETFLLF